MNAIPILVRMVELVIIFSTCTTAHVLRGSLERIVKLVSDWMKIVNCHRICQIMAAFCVTKLLILSSQDTTKNIYNFFKYFHQSEENL